MLYTVLMSLAVSLGRTDLVDDFSCSQYELDCVSFGSVSMHSSMVTGNTPPEIRMTRYRLSTDLGIVDLVKIGSFHVRKGDINSA